MGGLLLAGAVLLAGCHNNYRTSGYGIVWVTLTDGPGDFASYIVNVSSITLTRSDGAVVTALATNETADFTKLGRTAELWGRATIPIGTYTGASIILDYSNAFIAVLVNGLPVKASVVSSTGAAVTRQTIAVSFDPANPLVIAPTYATSSAQRLAIDLNLSASTPSVNLATSPPTVVVRPYLTAAIAPPDNKPVRVRGPLINSNIDVGAYTVYERPFYDEVNNLGSLTLFTSPGTIYTVNGKILSGAAGLTQLSQSSAGSTATAAYTLYQPTATPTATAGKFTALYVVAGSTLEDFYTQGLEGDVIGRNGNTLIVQGSTLFLNNGSSSYNVANAEVLVGPNTLVTADNTTLTGLNYNSIAVGQHIIVRGIYSNPNNVVTLDASGASSVNTGSVRLVPTPLWGSLISTGAGTLLMNLQNIDIWPVSDYHFAGNGASPAADPKPTAFSVSTASLPIPPATAGDPLWIDGLVAPFAAAPPDFLASSINNELGVQTAGAAAGASTCAPGTFSCIPASLRVAWSGPGTAAPFAALGAGGFSIDLANPNLVSSVIRIGPESIDLHTLPASPQLVPTAAAAPVTTNLGTPGAVTVTLPPVFLPAYSFGNPLVTGSSGIRVFSAFGTFATGLATALASSSALQLEARGTFDRATNTFNAISVDVVL